MKLNESKILILLASIVLGFLIVSQIVLGKFIPEEVLTLQSYQQASSEVRKLNDEINILNEKKGALSLKLVDYKFTGQSETSVIDKLSQELSKFDFNIGLTNVKGAGVTVSLADSPGYDNINTRKANEFELVHDLDILEVIWELKNSGAEAISVNDQRIIYNSEIYCGGPVIIVNGLELVPPYIIKAIGNPESLAYTLNVSEYYTYIKDKGLQTSIRKESDMKILKYDRNINYSYITPSKD